MSWETGIDIHNISTIICGSKVFFGAGAIEKMDFIAEQMAARGIRSVIAITGGASYEKSGGWAHVTRALEKHSIGCVLYNQVSANPKTHQVDEAVELARKSGCGAVIAIGGGSPIDAAKSVAVLLKQPGVTCRELFEQKLPITSAVPIIAINLTHGTGSEVNRFAVLGIPEKQYKMAIASDHIYPWYSIDDPALMTSLSDMHTRYSSIDALTHVIESCSSTLNNPLTIFQGKELIALIVKYLPLAVSDPNDLTARYFLAYAAMAAGIGFDNGMLHFSHALDHPIVALNTELSHGLILSVLLPRVLEEVYPARSLILAEVLRPVVPGLTGEPGEAKKAADGIRAWLKTLGVTERMGDIGFTKSDVPRLTDLVFETPGLKMLLDSAPVPYDRAVIEKLYLESF
ncbi:MAG: iron-containing alcohol dehydrogenase [Oscillospiraceae bacterium]|nr:iron-containing alcohol dehydrogenase [Oscillospiraceae bacterium]